MSNAENFPAWYYLITMYYLYILKCADGSLYTGITTDVERRFSEHKNKKGANYTRSHGASKIVHTEEFPDRSSAQKREAEIKKWTRGKKLELTKQI